MKLARAICFHLSRYRMMSRKSGDPGLNASTFDDGRYLEWRDADLRDQFERNFQVDLTGLDVLDFGCGGGGLSALVATMGVRSITGVDAAQYCIDAAKARTALAGLPVQPRFFVPSGLSTIDLPDGSTDVVLCFDTLEHIFHYEAIMREWRRVLRPGGLVLIWWCPWYHPYGHHVESLIPIPWAHVLFPERVLTATCARLYDMPEFTPRAWDLDESGRKKPNKWRALEQLPDVNRLTVSGFERACRRVGLIIERRDIVGFGGSTISRMTRVLTAIPGVREFFTSYVIYELRAPV